MFNLKTAKSVLIDLVVVWGSEPEVNEDGTPEFWQVDMVKEQFSEQDCETFFSKWSGLVGTLSTELCNFCEGELVS